MKPLKLQFKEALGGRNLTWYRDFTLIVIAGLAILFGVVFGMGADPVRAPFDLKVATGCFVLAGVCVLLASNRVLALSCAVIVPAAIAGFHAGFTGNRRVLVFCFASVSVGFLFLIVGTLAKSLWPPRPSRRSK